MLMFELCFDLNKEADFCQLSGGLSGKTGGCYDRIISSLKKNCNEYYTI